MGVKPQFVVRIRDLLHVQLAVVVGVVLPHGVPCLDVRPRGDELVLDVWVSVRQFKVGCAP